MLLIATGVAGVAAWAGIAFTGSAGSQVSSPPSGFDLERPYDAEIVETHRSVLRLNRRSRLNRQRLPGPHYNLGIFLVECLTFVDGIAEIVARHQPAGTRGWIRQGQAILATGTYVPVGTSLWSLVIRVEARHRRRFGLNLSALNTDDLLTQSSRDAGAVTVLGGE